MSTGENELPGNPGGVLKQLWRVALVCCASAAVLGAAFVFLLALALTLSSDVRISEHLRKAFDRGVLRHESYPVSPYGHMALNFDMFSDCLAFGTNLSNGEEGLLRRMAASPFVVQGDVSRLWKWEVGPCNILADALEADRAKADFTHLRYWHGYQVYVRPMLSIMSLENLRRLTAVLFFGALIFFAHRLALWFGPWAWPVALLPFFIVGDFLTVPSVISHALFLAWIFFSVALVTVILDRFRDAHTLILPVYVFSAGAVANFVSFLINPPLAPTLIAFLIIADDCRYGRHPTLRTVLYAGGLASLWFAGYFAAWVEKWFFAALVLGPDTVASEVIGSVGGYGKTGKALSLFEPTWHNIAQNSLFLGFIVASIATAVALIAWLMRTRRCARADVVDFLAMLMPLLVIVAWVELTPGHSDLHANFVSRSFLLFSVIPLLAALLIWRRTSPLQALDPAPGSMDASRPIEPQQA
jgi:hypothetical protein